MQNMPSLDDLFERRQTYPDFEPQERLARLVGLDDQKSRLAKILGLLVNPQGLERRATKRLGKRTGSRSLKFSRRSVPRTARVPASNFDIFRLLSYQLWLNFCHCINFGVHVTA